MRKKFMVKAAEGKKIETDKDLSKLKGAISEKEIKSIQDALSEKEKKKMKSTQGKSKVPSGAIRRTEDNDPRYKLEFLSTGGSVSRGNGIAIRGTKFKGVF